MKTMMQYARQQQQQSEEKDQNSKLSSSPANSNPVLANTIPRLFHPPRRMKNSVSSSSPEVPL
jgi:hypothetical protein